MKMTGEEAHRLVMELLPKDRLVYLPESFANKIAKTILCACTAESEASAAQVARARLTEAQWWSDNTAHEAFPKDKDCIMCQRLADLEKAIHQNEKRDVR